MYVQVLTEGEGCRSERGAEEHPSCTRDTLSSSRRGIMMRIVGKGVLLCYVVDRDGNKDMDMSRLCGLQSKHRSKERKDEGMIPH